MRNDIKYITQLTASDIKSIAAAANAQSGNGVIVVKGDGTMEIKLDKDVFRLWLWNFYHNGGFTATNPLNVSVDQVSQS